MRPLRVVKTLVLTHGWTYPFVHYNKKITVDVSRFVMLKYAAMRIPYRSRISNAKDDVSKNILLKANSLTFIKFFSSREEKEETITSIVLHANACIRS